MAGIVHLDLDGAWDEDLPAVRVDAREWGPRVRFTAPGRDVVALARATDLAAPHVLIYGSGDFHHLTAPRVLARAAARPLHVISFDNHPDWDRRPPRWACGGWVNRALGSPGVRSVGVWGCGNTELCLPGRLFAPAAAVRSGRLSVRPWASRLPAADRRRYRALDPASWRAALITELDAVRSLPVYVTVDLDAVREGEAVTDWEQGCFTVGDLAWALEAIAGRCEVAGADVCGAASPARYARRRQRFAAGWDHPRLPPRDWPRAREVNRRALERLWPALAAL